MPAGVADGAAADECYLKHQRGVVYLIYISISRSFPRRPRCRYGAHRTSAAGARLMGY